MHLNVRSVFILHFEHPGTLQDSQRIREIKFPDFSLIISKFSLTNISMQMLDFPTAALSTQFIGLLLQ